LIDPALWEAATYIKCGRRAKHLAKSFCEKFPQYAHLIQK